MGFDDVAGSPQTRWVLLDRGGSLTHRFLLPKGKWSTMSQVSLQSVCERIVEETDGALGCVVTDLFSGLPLASAVNLQEADGTTVFEHLSAGGARLFEIGRDGDDPILEVQTTTEDTYNFCALIPETGHLLLLVSDRGAANLGLSWLALRDAQTAVTGAAGSAPINTEDEPAGSSTPEERRVMGSRSRRAIWGQRTR